MTNLDKPETHLTAEEVLAQDPSLLDELISLNELIQDQLPSIHDDIEILKAQSVTHKESKTRARRSVAIVLIASLLGILGSMAITLGVVVPNCYEKGSILVTSTIGGPGYCSIIPSYDQSIKTQKAESVLLLKEEQLLSDDIARNKAAGEHTRKIQKVGAADLVLVTKQIQALEKKLGLPITQFASLPK